MTFEKRMNGNFGATLRLVNAVASLAVFIILATLWIGGRTETPEEKEKRTTDLMRPLAQQVEQNARDIGELAEIVREHTAIIGHPVMVERVRQHTEGDH